VKTELWVLPRWKWSWRARDKLRARNAGRLSDRQMERFLERVNTLETILGMR
jgi:hypothetical protein